LIGELRIGQAPSHGAFLLKVERKNHQDIGLVNNWQILERYNAQLHVEGALFQHWSQNPKKKCHSFRRKRHAIVFGKTFNMALGQSIFRQAKFWSCVGCTVDYQYLNRNSNADLPDATSSFMSEIGRLHRDV